MWTRSPKSIQCCPKSQKGTEWHQGAAQNALRLSQHNNNPWLLTAIYYHQGGLQRSRMKMKMLSLDKDLVRDAIRNVMRIDHFKQYYTHSFAYDVGQMIYLIRSKYARMIRVFTIALEYDKKYHHGFKHVPHLAEIQKLAMEIYNLVEMLEEYELIGEKRNNRMFNLFNLPQNFTFSNKTLSELKANYSNQQAKIPRTNPLTGRKNRQYQKHSSDMYQIGHLDGAGFDSDIEH
ncbi:unnamed protein product [Danaus chrysippus]|uniref:(African queen) hypothetical protein n=1 Tax=Danaus chrysippus TaxID=151541 RepID=A0A8J2MWB5_9NEOP|nr:unnamed protein product [Danaus chrysippus]